MLNREKNLIYNFIGVLASKFIVEIKQLSFRWGGGWKVYTSYFCNLFSHIVELSQGRVDSSPWECVVSRGIDR